MPTQKFCTYSDRPSCMELAFPGTNINILKWIKYMLLVGNDELLVKKKKKKKVEHHRPFPGPKLLVLDCRQEKAKLVKETKMGQRWEQGLFYFKCIIKHS